MVDSTDGESYFKNESFSFGSGGWLQLYSCGVAKYIQERGYHKDTVFAGCSTGALVATVIACDGNFDNGVDYCKNICIPRMYNHFFGLFKLHDYVHDCLDYACRIENSENITPGSLRIAVTKIPSFASSIFQTPFSSYDELKQCLLATCATFPFASPVFFSHSWMVDGTYTLSQPVVDANTVTVSPFYFSSALIKPSRYVPLWWSLFPPASSETIDWLYRLGYHDAKRYFELAAEQRGCDSMTNNLSSCYSRYMHIGDGSHPFDIPRKISMHRFLGFEVTSTPAVSSSSWFSLLSICTGSFMDVSLYLLLLFVWKPLAVTLIYTELMVVGLLNMWYSLLHEVYPFSPLLCVLAALIGPHVWILAFLAPGLVIYKLLLEGPSAASRFRDTVEYFACMGSFSLLVKFLPTPPTVNPVNKHERLSKLSFVYRLVRHFI